MIRCQSCSAPLEGLSGRCGYCNSSNDIDRSLFLRKSGEEKASPYACPACESPMRTVNIVAEAGGILMAEKCTACFGSFFAAGNLEAVLAHLGRFGFLIDAKRLESLGDGMRPEVRIAYRKCPVCAKLMNRVNFGQRSGVVTDQCQAHGVWLDPGELRRLVEWRNSGGLLHHQETQRQMEREKIRRDSREKEKRARLMRQAGYRDGRRD